MGSKEEKIRISHAYRRELIEDIVNANIKNYDNHKKQARYYYKSTDVLGIVNRIKGDSLRSIKNHSLSMNSMCCLAAEIGGMDAVMSHYQAEKYAILIEEASSEASLLKISDDFLYQYLSPYNRDFSNEYLPLSERVDVYISQNFMNDITVQSIAEKFFLSREHISRIYKKETGNTINQKILEVRVEETKRFLSETQMTVTEIALTVGFNSSQYFSKVFKRLTGLVPTEYREKKNITKLHN